MKPRSLPVLPLSQLEWLRTQRQAQTSVPRWTATDVDDGDTDTLTYTLGDTADDDSFAIVHEDTGQLQTLAALDYETKSDYEVTVTATDAGSETGTITVRINVMECPTATDGDTVVANSAPRFTEGPSATRSVAENTEAKEDISVGLAR